MANIPVFTGAVMLETMWETRGKDIIDLITPFIEYAVAKTTSQNQIINTRNVANRVELEFGYAEIPLTVIEKAFNRKPSVYKRETKGGKREYTLVKTLDTEVAAIDKRKDDCNRRIDIVSTKLSDYLSSHCKKKKSFAPGDAIVCLQEFFDRYGIETGTNRLIEKDISLKNSETDYYIAQYIFEEQRKNSSEYSYLIDLVKGYYLKSALYLQPENGNLNTASYSNITFYYDSPILIRLLGYLTAEEEKSEIQLWEALKKQKGHICYFPQAEEEVNKILTAYKYSIGKVTGRTLQGLDEKKYSSSSVDRILNTWKTKLSTSFSITEANNPSYVTDKNGKIIESLVLDEQEIKQCIKDCKQTYPEQSLTADVASLLSIHKLRADSATVNIEQCQAVFVTANSTLARVFNKYYREKVNSHTFPLAITDSDLAALTWIKCGMTSDIPETQLLKNSYLAMQPVPELLEKFSQILMQMQKEGNLTSEEALLLRTDKYTQKELLFASIADEESINEDFVQRAAEKLKSQLSREIQEKYMADRDDEKHHRLLKIENSAHDYAREHANKQKKRELVIAKILSVVMAIACIIGLIISTDSAFNIFSILFLLISILAVWDTIFSRRNFIEGVIEKRANQTETKLYQKKKNEYKSFE